MHRGVLLVAAAEVFNPIRALTAGQYRCPNANMKSRKYGIEGKNKGVGSGSEVAEIQIILFLLPT